MSGVVRLRLAVLGVLGCVAAVVPACGYFQAPEGPEPITIETWGFPAPEGDHRLGSCSRGGIRSGVAHFGTDVDLEDAMEFYNSRGEELPTGDAPVRDAAAGYRFPAGEVWLSSDAGDTFITLVVEDSDEPLTCSIRRD